MSIFDISGRLINTLIHDKLEIGFYSVEWNGKDQSGLLVSTGVYLIQVRSGKKLSTQKMAFIK